MTSKEEFRQFSHAMVDYIIDYHENIKDRPVLPSIKPGYLRPLIPEEAPEVYILLSDTDGSGITRNGTGKWVEYMQINFSSQKVVSLCITK